MASDDKKSIQIGFTSGNGISLKIDQADIDKIIKGIKDGTEWHEVTEDKRVVNIRLDHVDFYSFDAEKEERRAGFE
jgi:hypothetical protein